MIIVCPACAGKMKPFYCDTYVCIGCRKVVHITTLLLNGLILTEKLKPAPFLRTLVKLLVKNYFSGNLRKL
jgi:hypothetical protein